MKLIEGWWRAWSVQLLALCVALSELAQYLPEVREALPADWYRVAFVVVLVARMVKQRADE